MGRLLAGSILGTAVAAALSCVAPVSIDGASCPCPAGYCCEAGRCVARTSCRDGQGGTGGAAGGLGGAGIGDGSVSDDGGGGEDVAASDGGDGEGGSAASNGAIACGFTMPNPASSGLPNPAAYVTNSDDTVTDMVTGLTWARPVNSAVDTGAHQAPKQVCASMDPVGSWRLPTRIELVSLIDFTVPSPGPTIDQAHFSSTPAQSSATSTPYVGGVGATWYVNFNSGATGWGSSNAAPWTRCVRTTTTASCDATKRYREQSGGVVLDAATALTWQQSVDARSYTWVDAKTHCAGLGARWRLPSLTELQTIVDETKMAPSIDGTAFPNTPSAPFWTSSALANSTTEAWTVHFEGGYNGSAYPNVTTDALRIRCVR